jgi:LysR family glycine cleavage system transcriptional activator
VSQHVKALEGALGVSLFHRSARAIALTPEGRRYVPSIRAAFEMIAQATEETAPGLRGRKLRLGIAPPLDKTTWPTLRRLLSGAAVPEIVGMRVKDDPAQLDDDGALDALLRDSDEDCAGLHIDRLAVRDGEAGRIPVVLVTRPGIAGCRQHNNLVRLLMA